MVSTMLRGARARLLGAAVLAATAMALAACQNDAKRSGSAPVERGFTRPPMAHALLEGTIGEMAMFADGAFQKRMRHRGPGKTTLHRRAARSLRVILTGGQRHRRGRQNCRAQK